MQSQVPGPGTYGQGGIPSAVVEEKERKSSSNVGMLDSGKSCKRQLPEVVHMFIYYSNYLNTKLEIFSARFQVSIHLEVFLCGSHQLLMLTEDCKRPTNTCPTFNLTIIDFQFKICLLLSPLVLQKKTILFLSCDV